MELARWTQFVCMYIQSYLPLCNLMDCSPPGPFIHGIFQSVLEQVAISFSRGSSIPKDQTCVFCISCIGRRVLHQLSHQEALDDPSFVGSSIIRSQLNTCLFLSISPDRDVDLSHVSVTELLHNLCDLVLVGPDVHSEHQCGFVFCSLHGERP